MENTSSIGDASSALSDLRLVYPVAGDCQRGGTDNRIDLGLWLRACGLSAGQSYRIIYLHVPAAIWSMGIYASMAVAAFIGLVWQMKMANLALAAMAPIGAVFTFIALVTGSAWGKPMWAPGGSGMPDSPLNWCCCFSTLAPLRCGMPLTTAVWLVALPAFWC